MKHYTVEDIDYERYESKAKFELVAGSRPRLTLVHKKTRQKFIFKTYSHNSREVWAECLASHLGKVFTIDIQQVVIKRSPAGLTRAMRKAAPSIPRNWKAIGTLARNIFPQGQEITYGMNVVQTPSDPLSLEEIEKRIRAQYYAPDDLLDKFAEMVVFDAMIGNMDRHHENWGIVETIKYKQQLLLDKRQIVSERWFTPLFDHGSSLMFELSEEKVVQYLQDDELFVQKYIMGGPYSFVCMPNGQYKNVFDVIKFHITNKTAWKKRFIKHLQKMSGYSQLEVAKAIAKMPNTKEIDYSENRKELLLRSIMHRIQILHKMVQ